MALIEITTLVKIFRPENLSKICPPHAVKKSEGNVANPKQNIPKAAKIGLEIVAEMRKAP